MWCFRTQPPAAEIVAGLRHQFGLAPRSTTWLRGLCSLTLTVMGCESASVAGAPTDVADLRFFEGKTEFVSLTKVVTEKPYVTHCIGLGRIDSDGSLELVQHVVEEGRRDFQRRWQIRQVGPRQFVGTMSESYGPVTIDRVGNRYRFRFAMKGSLSVEQWLTPSPDMTTARTELVVRKFGIAVAHGKGWLRRTG